MKIELQGKIVFDPRNMTKFHNQSSKFVKVAMVVFNDDVSDYYAWFLKKQHGLILNPPVRGGHVTFIKEAYNGDKLWDKVKSRYNNRKITVVVSLEPQTDGKYWWLRVPKENREFLGGIRSQLGLGDYKYGLHMTIGYANEKNIRHSRYIARSWGLI